jgi:hypothetical protein
MRYVGITGFVSREEVDFALSCLPAGLTLMCGVLASSKTLCGHTNKYPQRYPKAEDIAAIFSDDPRCLNLVHVATDSTPSEVDGRLIPPFIDMLRGQRAGGPLYHGVQINCLRPPIKRSDLVSFVDAFPKARVVLQIGPRWLAAKLNKPFLSGTGGVSSLASDILLDVSGGRGTALDAAKAAGMVRALRRELVHWGLNCRIGIAGGLCAEALPTIAPLVREHGLSIDAEGRLRDGDEGGVLNLDKARAYLRAAGEVFGAEGQCDPRGDHRS